MKARVATALALVALCVAIPVAGAGGAQPPAAPSEFFGIAPQTELTLRDAEYMKSGGIGSVRFPVIWSSIQPSPRGGYDWSELDKAVGVAARGGLRVLPFLYSTPHWVGGAATTLPINSNRAKNAWSAFLRAAVERYGPKGTFWAEHKKPKLIRQPEPGGIGTQYTPGTGYENALPTPTKRYEPAVPKLPIRTWQIWNEANFFYFALPASPTRYAKLLTISSKAVKQADPGAKVLVSGLFGKPNASGAKGMPAARFLRILYRTPGIKSRFDGIALHPYAVDSETLEELVEEFHEVALENHDRPWLYLTEIGWGSQNNFQQVAFEQGIKGQVKQLRGSYTYLLENRRRLSLKGVYWYSWKDNPAYTECSFCDSVGLFHAGTKFKSKPAWHAFVAFSGGSARP